MPAIRLEMKPVERVWGRRSLPPPFEGVKGSGEPIGELWFEGPEGTDVPLLVKYLFTSEKLSIQVHPDDEAARAKGHEQGKDEAWVVLDGEPGAAIGIGVTQPLSPDRLRAAALDGSIEGLVDWRPVGAGDFFYSPAGTIHAIGAGVSLIEIQQYSDVTYRLYDYGRGRGLHLEESIAVANACPYTPPFEPFQERPGREILAAGGKFVLERWSGPCRHELGLRAPAVLAPFAGAGSLDEFPLRPGDVWVGEGDIEVALERGSTLLIAYAGAAVANLFRDEGA